jgi:hypothetical protein
VLRPEQILERLGRSLDLLTSGVHDAPERQRTLRGTVDWSYRLLDDDEQRLFAQVAVFSGSFEVEAAEAVCSADLDVLQSLVRRVPPHAARVRGRRGRFAVAPPRFRVTNVTTCLRAAIPSMIRSMKTHKSHS